MTFTKAKVRIAFAALLSLGLLSAGCGDSDDETTTATLSKAQFIKQADEICGKTEGRQLKRIEEFQKRQLPPGPKAERELVLFAGIPPLALEAEELEELPLPGSGGSEAEAFIESFSAGVEKAEKDPTSLLGEKTNPFAEAEKLAREFGFKVCGGA
jgi:hypothetical protein